MSANKSTPKVEIFETRDGSSSLLLPEMNETYHSTHGAVTESKYVFLKMGLEYWQTMNSSQKTVRILEIGFGTGLNVWLTALAAEQAELKVHFTTYEKYPLATDIINHLNYTDDSDEGDQSLFTHIHQCEWSSEQQLSPHFGLQKNETDIFEADWQIDSFDIIFFDAFAPSKQPEMWSLQVLENMYKVLGDNGIFVTYCAQGQFKRDLKAVGFEIETLEGPPGKKQMTRGTKRMPS